MLRYLSTSGEGALEAAAFVQGLTFRPATPADAERVAELIAGDPPQEAIGIAGDARKARAIGMVIQRLPGMPAGPGGLEHTLLAELDGETVGAVNARHGSGRLQITPSLVLAAVRIFGPIGTIRLLPRLRARERVDIPTPEGAYRIAELDVDPRYRNRGIGGALLDRAEAQAREGGHRLLTLETTTVNPARRLYERHGFRVTETRTDPEYERYTGIPGRVRMLKELA